jgi:hypothetical protein
MIIRARARARINKRIARMEGEAGEMLKVSALGAVLINTLIM